MEKEETMEDLFDAYEELKPHQKVKGTVLAVNYKDAYVDLHQFTEGKIFLDHFTTDKSVDDLRKVLHVGDEIEAEVTRVDELNSVILLSRLNMEKEKSFAEFKDEAQEEKLDIEARVKKIIPQKGYILDYKGISCFMPIKDVKEELKIGQKILVRVINVDEERKSAFVSHYVIEKERREAEHLEYLKKKEEERKALEEERQKELDSLNVGDVCKGVVQALVPYGAFVKLDKVQGLIRLKEIDHDFIKQASEKLNVGDEVTCKVLSKENGKLELSRKACIKSPFELYTETHHVGDTIKCKVINKLTFGLLCQLDEKVTGLLHKSEFSWNPNDNLMASTLIGDEIEVAILKIDKEKGKISLSKKALIDNPWSRVNASKGDVVDCKITEITPQGLKVEALEVDGIIPSKYIRLDGKSSKLDDYYAVDDEIKGIIEVVDPKHWELVISQKAYKEREERMQFEEYMEKEEATEQKTTLGDLFKEDLK
jgi:small subunit ribosomal protein S1